ncbi:hypothetical protein AB0C27_25700 [Nonomuraea sp. NPDC048882]|uniref:hypothetical protein n=1 Tax=unclassified Nonomuraea TaxID=2593643 RepID=UPI0033D62AEE
MDSASKPVWAPENPETEIGLPATAGWSPLTWTVPEADRLHAIGMQLYSGADTAMTVGIDALTW